MIDGKLSFSGTAIGALKSISDQNVAFGKRHPGPVNRPDQFDQTHHGRDFKLPSAGIVNGLLRIPDDLNLSLGHQAKSALPVHHIQKRVIGIQQHTLCHHILPQDSIWK
jgi:hypothetical protein